MAAVEIVSFGYLHDEPPAAHLTVDLRHHFRDPDVSPELRYMTADDEPVRTAVLSTPGVAALVLATAAAVDAFTSGPSAGTVTVADGCAGGRHRAPPSPAHSPNCCATRAMTSPSGTATSARTSSTADRTAAAVPRPCRPSSARLSTTNGTRSPGCPRGPLSGRTTD